MTAAALLQAGHAALWVACAYVALRVLAMLPLWPIARIITMGPGAWRADAVACMLGAWVRGMLVLPADLVAPVVVPVALLFTPWRAERLPRLFAWWDNDICINGDVRQPGSWALQPVPLDDNADARAMCYWAKGSHPRSFWARFVWLGLRNRASRLAQQLGTNEDGDYSATSKGTATLLQVGNAWLFAQVVPLGAVQLRFRYGYKVPPIPCRKRSPVVAIGFSIKRNS